MRILQLFPFAEDFPVLSTRRQFERYVEWWGTEQFPARLRVQVSEKWPRVQTVAGDLMNALAQASAPLPSA